MYQDIFAIDSISYLERKKNEQETPAFFLKNYNYYHPQLEKEFYLKYFIRKILFDIDIIEVKDFLDNQYINSKKQEQLIKITTLKVVPAIDNIINNAQFSIGKGGYFNEVKLEDGFIETEGVIKNEKYEFHSFYHIANFNSLKEELLQRKQLITEYIDSINALLNGINSNQLEWCGKPSHLAFIIRKLVDEGFIKAPIAQNGEINVTELSRQILQSFSIINKTTLNTLRVYSNSDSEKFDELKKSFDNQGFNLPNSALVS